MSGDIGLEPLTLGTHMGPDVTRHRPHSLATRCEPMLHVAKTDVAQDSKTGGHCQQDLFEIHWAESGFEWDLAASSWGQVERWF